MGRKFQVGSLDEILTLNQEIEGTQLVVDWAHLHALHQGSLKKTEDFRAIAEKVEERLGTEAMRSMHCHFTKIEFTALGEKKHHTLTRKGIGPDFHMLAEVIADFEMHPTMICESPILDVDARKMKETLTANIGKQTSKTALTESSLLLFASKCSASCSSCTVLMLTASSSRSSR